MFKSIKNIIILVIILVLVGMIPHLAISTTANNIKNLSQNTNIIINDDGIIEVIEKVTFKSNKTEKKDVNINYCLNMNTENRWIRPKNVKVKINGRTLETNRNETKPCYFFSATIMTLDNINLVKNKEYVVEIYYEYDAIDVVEEYNDLAVLKLIVEDKVPELNIRIQLPRETNIFELSNKAETEYLGNNTYNISKMRVTHTELLIDKGVIENAKKINEEYETTDSAKISIISTITILSIFTIIILVLTFILTRKVKCDKTYVRNPDEVIEPILAEAIIDRKIGAKELMMSCIIELIYRGNLKNIGNDKVQLLNYEKMSDYEKEIIGLIFKEEKQIVAFDEIRKIFIKNNKKTTEFFKKFIKIKRKIENKLFDYNIYSKLGEHILRIIKMISIDIILSIIYVLFIGILLQQHIELKDMINYIVVCTAIAIAVSYIEIQYIIKRIFWNILIRIQMFVFLAAIIAIAISYNLDDYIIQCIYNNIGDILLMLIIVVLNIIILIKTKSHIFTETGKIEFARANGLKQYIVEYSLIKDRDIESTIIWDEYLAYAVAFGIPNKITDKFDENLMKTNITLQKIESILKFG